jgi:hypothetical protein
VEGMCRGSSLRLQTETPLKNTTRTSTNMRRVTARENASVTATRITNTSKSMSKANGLAMTIKRTLVLDAWKRRSRTNLGAAHRRQGLSQFQIPIYAIPAGHCRRIRRDW